jgi:D-serine deaminase-like pyridoxal phosphate-dependent protein
VKDAAYVVENADRIPSPALLVFSELVERNVREMIRIAGSAARLRPHAKTHKMAEVAALELSLGIIRHKCATLAEAEMLARAGVRDVVLAYPPVGPHIDRVVRFRQLFPDVELAVTADHPGLVETLSRALAAAGRSVQVLLDVDTGLQRTGVPAGPEAMKLYRTIAASPGLVAAGFHVYDGHQHQRDRADRSAAVGAAWERIAALRSQIESSGLPVPRLVVGGTGSFPVYAAMTDFGLELSPGTCVLHDAGYASMFPDLHFVPAALVLTRVISRPSGVRITLDAGYKACAADPPLEKRLVFPDLPTARIVLHNEEHIVLETPDAPDYQPGDVLLAIPWHICPTTALHREVYVVRGGRWIDRWAVVARDRQLTI